MDTDRKTMEAILRRDCVPVLRDLGFKGAFPHFHRVTGGFVALANVQFASAGGSFCVNLGYADPGRRNVYHKPETPPEKLRVSQTREFVRLGAVGGDRWFVFGRASASPYRGGVMAPEEIAAECNALLRTEAAAWWERMRAGG